MLSRTIHNNKKYNSAIALTRPVFRKGYKTGWTEAELII